MLDTLQIVETSAQPAAVIRLTIPRAEIQTAMGPAIAELMAAVAAQGQQPAGAIFSHHFKMDPETFDFEVGVPVAAAIAESGRVKMGGLPATTVARTVYTGPYEGLGAAWGEFNAMLAEAGHAAAPNLWECYVAGPEKEPDASTYRTELNRPLAR